MIVFGGGYDRGYDAATRTNASPSGIRILERRDKESRGNVIDQVIRECRAMRINKDGE